MTDADDTPRQWDVADGPLTEETIRALYPRPRYRVMRKTLPPDDVAGGGMEEMICFCLAGHGTYTFGAKIIALTAGEYVRLPGGSYRKETTDAPFDCVLVWELPESHRV
jgi:hypothetical protein